MVIVELVLNTVALWTSISAKCGGSRDRASLAGQLLQCVVRVTRRLVGGRRLIACRDESTVLVILGFPDTQGVAY